MACTRWLARFCLVFVLLLFGVIPFLWVAMRQPLPSRSATVETVVMDGVNDHGVSSTTLVLSHTVALPLITRNYASPPNPSSFGVQMYGAITEGGQALNLARGAQAYWVRWPLAWRGVEPADVSPDEYLWDAIDASIANACASGHRVIATIVTAPTWAADYPQGPVLDAALADFAEFVGEVAERYDGDGNRDAPGSPVVDHFEFFNEPDSTNLEAAQAGYGSYYGLFGARYAAMLYAVSTAVKASNASARVVFGGIAYDSFTTEGGSFNPVFLDDVLTAGGGAWFDVMNFHYYPAFAPKWYAFGNGLQGKATYLRDKLVQYGYGDKPMVVTEAGWHSDYYSEYYPGSPEIQSRYVVQLFAQAAAARLESMIWWTWIDPGFPYGANGLLTAELSPKISYSAYGVAADRIGQAQFDRIMQTGPGGEGYRFVASGGRPVYVLWANDGLVHIHLLEGAQARVIDMYGHVVVLVSDATDGQIDGQVTVSFGTNPVYVEIW